jgi:hypothetical protein
MIGTVSATCSVEGLDAVGSRALIDVAFAFAADRDGLPTLVEQAWRLVAEPDDAGRGRMVARSEGR